LDSGYSVQNLLKKEIPIWRDVRIDVFVTGKKRSTNCSNFWVVGTVSFITEGNVSGGERLNQEKISTLHHSNELLLLFF
jgi:hypothetical protein